MRVVLVGMKGCGKSTLGHALAQRWGCEFFDTDHLLEALHHRQSGQRLSFRELFSQLGPEGFARLEEQVVLELAARLGTSDQPAVVSLGGRTALNPHLHETIRRLGTIVYLDNEPAELYRRVSAGGELPAFLDRTDPEGSFARLYAERAPQYRQLADVALHLRGLGLDQSLRKLCEIIEAHNGR